jgi:hypothetical protein
MLRNIERIDKRDQAILIGLFLSRFDKRALESFGFTGFHQAYNVLGFSIGIKPKSINNYRDEFDPYFPNERKGWYKRELRDYCREYMDATSNMSFDEFYNVIKSFVDGCIIDEKDIVREKRNKTRGFMANRLITGKAAEEYFAMVYQTIDVFYNYDILNTTQMGCGFDFKLSLNNSHYYIEVKGLNEKTGSILMTEKEHDVADDLRDLYCLFVVSNFCEKPEHRFFFNPLYTPQLDFKRQEQTITRISYSTKFV